MKKSSYNVVIVDDHPIVIEGLLNLLSDIEFINVVATFTSGKNIFAYENLKVVDIIFLDIFLQDSNGIDICLKLKKKYPNIVVLAISSQSETSIVMQMLQNGANGYLLKSATLSEFKKCILDAIEGRISLCNQVREIINIASKSEKKNIPRLTLREKEILALLREGKSTQEISNQLFLSFLTVQTHRRNLLNKYKTKNIVELLNFVSSNGLL